MGIFQWLLLAFLLIPVVEIYVLVQVGSLIGALPTVAMVVLTAVLGAALIRTQGLSTLARLQGELERGELPALTMIEGAVLLVAGALLLTPGFVTDAIGFACLVPGLRRALISRVLAAGLEARVQGGRAQGRSGPRTIEGEYRREEDR